jgi:hypothetical protein
MFEAKAKALLPSPEGSSKDPACRSCNVPAEVFRRGKGKNRDAPTYGRNVSVAFLVPKIRNRLIDL